MSSTYETVNSITLVYKTTSPREIFPFRIYNKRNINQCNKEHEFEPPIAFRLNYYNTVKCTPEFISWLSKTLKKILECDKFKWAILIHDLNQDLKEALKDLYA